MSQPPYGQGPGGPGMPPPPPGMGAPPADTSGNVLNLLSMIAGIVSIVLCCLWAGVWGGVPAIVLGILGRKKAENGQASNKTMGTVGLILGIIGVAFFLVQIILAVSGVSTDWVKQMQNQT
ncbi:DUF4190 domain-containing protein [Actinocatenispora thailandica]|nr:DUF4190 domain-containing protein [Actinocatenispora thailandica]